MFVCRFMVLNWGRLTLSTHQQLWGKGEKKEGDILICIPGSIEKLVVPRDFFLGKMQGKVRLRKSMAERDSEWLELFPKSSSKSDNPDSHGLVIFIDSSALLSRTYYIG